VLQAFGAGALISRAEWIESCKDAHRMFKERDDESTRQIHQAIAGEFAEAESSFTNGAIFQEIQQQMTLGCRLAKDSDSRASLAPPCEDRELDGS